MLGAGEGPTPRGGVDKVACLVALQSKQCEAARPADRSRHPPRIGHASDMHNGPKTEARAATTRCVVRPCDSAAAGQGDQIDLISSSSIELEYQHCDAGDGGEPR